MQQALDRAMEGRTSIVIAHRLNTIMDSSKILVLDDGNVAEFGPPVELLNNPEGLFTSLVNATGAQTSMTLRKIAAGELNVTDSVVPDAEQINDEES